jgi:hypothetical protein
MKAIYRPSRDENNSQQPRVNGVSPVFMQT